MAFSESEVEERIKKAIEIISNGQEENLTPDTWGIFSSDDGLTGAGVFTWFDSSENLFNFLADYVPFYHPDFWDYGEPDFKLNVEMSSTIEFYADGIRSLQTQYIADEIEKNAILEFVNDSDLYPASKIEWFGQMKDIATNQSEFELRVRSDFSLFHETNDEFEAGVPRSLLYEFHDYIGEYVWA